MILRLHPIAVRRMPDPIVDAGSRVMSKVPKILEMSAGGPTMPYYSISRKLFKSLVRRMREFPEETAGREYREYREYYGRSAFGACNSE